MTAIQGWSTQPSIEKLKILLTSQETLAKQMSGVSLNTEEMALFTNKKKNQTRGNNGGKT